MSLSVNGFIIRKENFKYLDKITELLSLGIKRHYYETNTREAVKLLKTVFSEETAILNDSINSNLFYKTRLSKLVMYKKLLNENYEVDSIPEQESILSLIKRIEKDLNETNHSYHLSFLASDSDFLLVQLPLNLKHNLFNREIFKYIENYSVSDQVDSIPPHFDNYEQKQICIEHWQEFRDSPCFYFSAWVLKDSLSLFEILKTKPTSAFISKVKTAYYVYTKYYRKDEENKTDYDIMDEIENLKETEEFKEHMKKEIHLREKKINDFLNNKNIL
tara:strand:+ start:42564 stop:43388 length:825 start_codon:yes stop_codon:yes gene_type:complete